MTNQIETALKAAQQSLWQYRDDLRRPPEGDGVERRQDAADHTLGLIDGALTIGAATTGCKNCNGSSLVCEFHQDTAWLDGAGCCGGAGAPCPICDKVRAFAPITEILREMIALAPQEKPEGPYDEWGGYSSDNYGDIIAATKEEAAWCFANYAKNALAQLEQVSA